LRAVDSGVEDPDARNRAELEPLWAGLLAQLRLEEKLRIRLTENLDAARVVLAAVRKEPWVEGSTGQTQAAPGFAVARDCDATALALYRELTRYRMSPEEFIDAGDDRVFVFSREGGRGRGSGAEVETHPTAHLWTLRDGKAIRMQSYWERADALEAAGLRE
jgi:ketosteroid isomerase-like protein